MKEKDKRPTYEAPRARDLSASGVSGANPIPQAVCTDGSNPWSTCVTGVGVAGGTGCAPTGNSPVEPKCGVGSNALIGCISGSNAS